MIALVQRVNHASVQIDGKLHASISKGMLVLLGIEQSDEEPDIEYLSKKIMALRIFSDINHKMNLSVQEIGGEILLVSQFTLVADTSKGNRPSYAKAADPEKANQYYQKMIHLLAAENSKPIQTGVFEANMQISLQNDGPVSIILNSKNSNYDHRKLSKIGR
jgi:D-tyrosyl-tRNA(Tyr) deacylase